MKKSFLFHIESSHIWFTVEIKWMASKWKAALVLNELSSSSSCQQCKDRQVRVLIVYSKIEYPSKVLHQMCDVRARWLLYTFYTSTLRIFWTLHIKNDTKLSMNNQLMSLWYVFTPLYQCFIKALLNWRPFFKELVNRCCLPTFELSVHVLTFSFRDDQHTSVTNQKIAIYAGKSSYTAEILSQGLTCWYASLVKGHE